MKLLDIVKYRLNLPLNKELENRPEKGSLFKKVSMATLIDLMRSVPIRNLKTKYKKSLKTVKTSIP